MESKRPFSSFVLVGTREWGVLKPDTTCNHSNDLITAHTVPRASICHPYFQMLLQKTGKNLIHIFNYTNATHVNSRQ